MVKPFIYKVLFVMIWITMSFWACEPSPMNDVQTSTKSNREMLNFKSLDEFHQTVVRVGKMNEAEQNSYESLQGGFVSLRSAFQQAMREEQRNYELEENKTNSVHTPSALLIKYPNMVLKSEVGGYEMNIADARMASLLNPDGMVRIGESIYQYTRYTSKAIKDSPLRIDEVELLKTRATDDPTLGLVVGQNTIRRTEIKPTARVADNVFANRSCDVWDNGGSPAKYRLITYEESIAIEEPTGNYTITMVTTNIPYLKEDGTVGQITTTYPVASQSGRVYYSVHQVKVRTLKRGTFGSWYNCDTSLQRITGTFTLQGTVVLAYSQFGVLSGPLSYDRTPGSTTDTFVVTLAESQRFSSAAESQNVRFTASSGNDVKGVDG